MFQEPKCINSSFASKQGHCLQPHLCYGIENRRISAKWSSLKRHEVLIKVHENPAICSRFRRMIKMRTPALFYRGSVRPQKILCCELTSIFDNLFIVNLQYISVNTTIWYMYLLQYNTYYYSSYMFRLSLIIYLL